MKTREAVRGDGRWNAHWMARAWDAAELAMSYGEVPVGAVLVRDGIEVASAHNRREQEHSPFLHAEIVAMSLGAKSLGRWRLHDCELYVTLEPCPMCLAALQQARIKRVVYGAKDSKGGALSLGYALNKDKKLNHRFDVDYFKHIDCENILKQFFKKRRLAQAST